MIMTVQDMHQQFLHWYDKQSNFSAPEVTPEEIDIYLNNAQYQFLKILTEKGLEKSQEWLDYTKNITLSYTATPGAVPPATNAFALLNATSTSTNKPNGYFVHLPKDNSGNPIYRLALLEEAQITYNECGVSKTARVPVIPVTRDEYNKVAVNPFKKPWKEDIIRLTTNTNLFELIAFPGATITAYYLDYLKEPGRIQYGTVYTPTSPGAGVNLNCELESKAGTKIVEIAVELALKTVGDQRLPYEQYDKLVKTI